jgi:hypothetical protein
MRSVHSRWAAVLLSLLALQQCTTTPPTGSAPVEQQPVMTPVLSVKELMEHVIDPTADWIFDAAVVDITPAGVAETQPKSDEDWLKVERGALLLAEASNLLKMPRAMAPPGTERPPADPGQPPPELSPAEIQAKIDMDPARWNGHADALRAVALASLPVIRTRDAEALFKIGNDIDNACEGCHLEFWYPGDKPLVDAQRNNRATYEPPK